MGLLPPTGLEHVSYVVDREEGGGGGANGRLGKEERGPLGSASLTLYMNVKSTHVHVCDDICSEEHELSSRFDKDSDTETVTKRRDC